LHQADAVFGHVGVQVQRQLLAGSGLQAQFTKCTAVQCLAPAW
jgi:hypothetical protein